MDIAFPILNLVLGAFLGVAFKYWYDYRGMVYKELWEKRCTAYKRLFSMTGILPDYPEKAEVRYQQLFERSREMSDWFFGEGGLLCSKETRNKYFKVQDNISEVLQNKSLKRTETITKEYDSIRDLMSQLRRAMTDDLMSRSRM
ncbi:hypothetical protein QEG73_05195 [Chitinophagaceae bacterium 26-R-25]|nr:hypothetical protein [Chitinophagaceae bacterium 26-R-25]